MERQGLNTWTLDELRREFEHYSELVNGADLAPASKATYIVHADRYLRWLGGEIDIKPGGSPGRRRCVLPAVGASIARFDEGTAD